MPPDSYTTVTISDNVAMKRARSMSQHDCSSYAEAIESAADRTLLQEEETTILELIQLLAERADGIDESNLQ
ncbi:hypothetical protein BRD00_13810 [Halobacteriales archaeon QS_8_69_26]|nr:MAG: hypothetical protein BRD00_13810 [Halobacteriales archaeon QS_8_69_26]